MTHDHQAAISWSDFLKSALVNVLTERFYFIDHHGEVDEKAIAGEFRTNFIRNFLDEGLEEAPAEIGQRFDDALAVTVEVNGEPRINPMWLDMRFIAAPIAALAVMFDRLSSQGFEANLQMVTEQDDQAMFGRRLSSISLRRSGAEAEEKASAMIYAAAAAFLLEETSMLLAAYLLLEGVAGDQA